jgi:nicotinate dehydrogenase subunit B
MSTKRKNEELAPEQYELHEGPSYQFSMKRRSFFEIMGAGIAVAFSASSSWASVLYKESPPEDQLSSWIHIGNDGKVTVFTGKAEVGQNIRTSLAQIVAEELPVPFESITMVMGDTALTPYDRGTFGSRSTPYMGPQLRKAAATAREVLLEMAAVHWNVKRDTLTMEAGLIKSRDRQKSIAAGELTKGKKLLYPLKENAAIKPVGEWKVAGTALRKVNGESFVNGKHKFVSDMKLPGMLHGKVLRAPAYGSTLVSADVSKAQAMKGVTVVRDGDFIGVTAPTPASARAALASIATKWGFEKQPAREEIFSYLKQHSEKESAASPALYNAFNAVPIKADQTFHINYIAHVPLEPRAGLATWEGNKLTVWTGTQRPFGVQEELAEIFNMPKDNIRVIQPDTGSGYGGKHTGEAGIEAARLSKAAGKPVKIVWTREEEFTWAYFRPAGVIEVKASCSSDGMMQSWEFHNYNSGGSGIDNPYEVQHEHIKFHHSESPLRQGSYRALAAPANVFARESIIDDLAVAAKIDPLTFRLKNLGEPRMKAVLEAAAEKFGWSGFKPSRTEVGKGIACGTEKASFVATCAEVSIDEDGNPVVDKVVVAYECGAIINPEHLKNQVQGAIIQGLGGALFEKIDFREGKILNASLAKYRVPRFSDTPELHVVLLNRKDIDPAGAGETPIIAIAPAIRNAILNATGKKLYTLPLSG